MKKNLFLFFCIYVIIFLRYLFMKGVLFMKKSSFSFGIVLFIFSFFLFNTDVYAAKELSCLYKKTATTRKVALVQDASGNITIYKNKKDADFSAKIENKSDKYNDWYTSTEEVVFDDSVKKESDGSLSECPAAKYTERDGSGKVTFYGSSAGHKKEILTAHSDKVEYVETNRKATVQASQQLTIDMKFTKTTISSCEDLFKDADDLLDLIKSGITIVKIAIPLILIVMGTMDFAQAIFASNEDGIKKAQSKFTKRVIIAVVIFLIPSILKALLSIAHSIWPVVDATLCGII